MANIDFGAGPNTPTGDTVAQALAKLQARIDALGTGTPTPTPGSFNIVTYGAVADASGAAGNGTDNKDAIDAAIAACKAAPLPRKLVIPAGKFRSTAIRHLIDYGDVEIEWQGELIADYQEWGWVGWWLIDGYSASAQRGYINNVTITGTARITTPPGRYQDTVPRRLDDGRFGQILDIAPSTPFQMRGVNGVAIDEVRVLNSIVWSISFHDCKNVTATHLYSKDAQQDGTHLTGGCEDFEIDLITSLNVGDDGFAIGYQPQDDVNQRIHIGNIVCDGVGAYGAALYGPTQLVDIDTHDIRNTWLGGIKAVPVQLASRTEFVNKASVVQTVTIGSGTMQHIGFRPATAQYRNQGDGVAVGIQLDTGGLVANIAIAAQTMDHVRNAFVARAGAVTNVTLASGGSYTNLVAGGGGQAQNPTSGYSRDMPNTYALVTPAIEPGAVIASDNLDSLSHADAAPSGGNIATTTGNKLIVPGPNALIGFANNKMVFGAGLAYPIARVDIGQTTVDFEIAYHGNEGVYLAVGSNETTGQAVLADLGGGGLYARNGGPPIDGSSVVFPVITGPDHLVRVILTATKAILHLDGSFFREINLPTSGWAPGPNVAWGIYSGNTQGPGGTGFNQLSIRQLS